MALTIEHFLRIIPQDTELDVVLIESGHETGDEPPGRSSSLRVVLFTDSGSKRIVNGFADGVKREEFIADVCGVVDEKRFTISDIWLRGPENLVLQD